MRARQGLPIAMVLALAGVGCGEPERPAWGFSDAAIDKIDLEGMRFGDPETIEEPVAEGCQQFLRMRLEEKFPGGEPSAEEIRGMLRSASRIGNRCAGSCDGEICKAQVQTAMRDRMQSARTRCVCAPREKPPCAFVVGWELGDETRRRIRSLSCVAGEEDAAGSCGFLIGGRRKELTLSCALTPAQG